MSKRTPVAEQPTQIFGRQPQRQPERKPLYPRAAPPPPPDIYVPVAAPRRSRSWWLPLLLLAALALLGVALVVAAGVLVYRSPRILPGIHTLGVELGGLDEDAAATLLATSWQARAITLDAGQGVETTLPPASLGLILDATATARAAHRQGRDLRALPEALQYRASAHGFPPVWYFDPAIARSALEQVAPQVAVAPVNAGIALEGGRVVAAPGAPGRALDVAASLAWLQQNAAAVVEQARFPLVLAEVAPPIADSSAIAAEANAFLTRPLQVTLYDPIRDEQQQASVPPEVWATWLSLAVGPDNPQGYRWEVNPQAAVDYLNAQAAGLGGARYVAHDEASAAVQQAIASQDLSLRLRLYYHERTHTVQADETFSSIGYDYGIPYPWIQQANPDAGDALRVGQQITIPSPDALLPLPIVENKRIVVSISQQRMWAYENGALKWEWPVSTGIDSSPTAPGVFQIQSHEENAYAANWDLWMPSFMGIYRPVPTSDFMNGFHGFPTRSGTNLLWTNSLGRKVTYGCILVSNDNIALLYPWAEEGVVVHVQP